MSDAQKRVMLVAPSSDERTDLASALLDYGMDVVLADDAGRAIRQLGDGVDVLIIHRDERKLACESLARLAASKKSGLRLFAFGPDAAWKTTIQASPLPATGNEAALALAKHLGLDGAASPAGPTMTAEALLWASPRSSVQIMLARRGADQVAYLRSQCEWADAFRDAFISALKRTKAAGCIELDLAWIDDTGVNAVTTLRPGRSLLAHIASQTLSLQEAAPIVHALLATMDRMHRAPEPTLFGPVGLGQVWIDQQVRFLFGGATRIANNYDRSLRGRSYPAIPMLASPEEISNEGASPASDVFYAAVFLYELLTGCEPYNKQMAQPYFDAIRSGHFRDVQVYVPALDAKVAGAIHSALSPQVQQRPSVADFARLLER
jgi:hypothetical protein